MACTACNAHGMLSCHILDSGWQPILPCTASCWCGLHIRALRSSPYTISEFYMYISIKPSATVFVARLVQLAASNADKASLQARLHQVTKKLKEAQASGQQAQV